MRWAPIRWHDRFAHFLIQRRLLVIALLVALSWAFFLTLLWLASLLA
ncbi:hypothetical protein [Devosia nitrariae]|nr:hypothetical protein [Devosia nitrariae]